ncbi:hypothetical protein [Shinella sp.]|uniref:hypothetical protein n=1 Tax=Shinella sp. TaxID=1870904 RepID=UPI003F6F9ECB
MSGGYGLLASAIAAGVASSSAYPLSAPAPQTVLKRTEVSKTPTRLQPKIVTKKLPRTVKTVREAQIDNCVANGGKWYVVIRPVTLTATGSDVDELYGRISLFARRYGQYPLSHYSSIASVTNWNGDRRIYDIWYSKENSNIGKFGGKNLATITITMEGTTKLRYPDQQANYLDISLYVSDEDGARGGSDDEHFRLSNSNHTTYDGELIYRIYTPEPSCFDAPVFAYEKRVTVNAHSNGNNRMSLNLHVKWFRGL